MISGAGNRDGDGIDGAVQGSVVATYLQDRAWPAIPNSRITC